jgi:hypothetical protein
MSRLDSFIRRLEAQRACLDLAAGAIAGIPGPVLELGLGNGRTYDHLRELLPDREIFVFERQVAAHPACIPDATHLFEGEIRETLTRARLKLPAEAALAHSDMGTGDAARNAELAAWIAETLPALLAADAIVVADQQLENAVLQPCPLPAGIAPERYFIYRHVPHAPVRSP